MNSFHIMAVVLASCGAFGCFMSRNWKDVALVAMLFGMSTVFLFIGA